MADVRPAFIPPMLATLVAGPFDDPGFLFEVKWDGFRIEAVVDEGTVRLYTRGGQAGEAYFGDFMAPPTWIGARTAVVDGEVVAFGPDGEPDFALLQDRIKRRRLDRPTVAGLVYQAFDLLVLDGRSLLAEPLEARKSLLEEVLRPDSRVRYSGHVERDGLAFYDAAKARRLEGMMAKDRGSPYLPGKRSGAWQKVKIRPEQELVVGGWTAGKGALADTLGAVHVGVYEDGRLRYAGKVGSGFNRERRDDLLELLAPLTSAEPPFEPPPPRRLVAGTTWVRPEVVVRAEFAGWTGDGLVRQAALKGVDLGKDPRAVVREVPGSGR